MLVDFSSHLMLPPFNFELISDYICCAIRNPNAEPLYHMEAGPVYLTNHGIPEVYRVHVRGRSPAFHALSANFENPPPVVIKVYPTPVSYSSTYYKF